MQTCLLCFHLHLNSPATLNCLPTWISHTPSLSCLLLSSLLLQLCHHCFLAAPLLTLSPPSLRWDRRGSSRLHRRLCCQPFLLHGTSLRRLHHGPPSWLWPGYRLAPPAPSPSCLLPGSSPIITTLDFVRWPPPGHPATSLTSSNQLYPSHVPSFVCLHSPPPSLPFSLWRKVAPSGRGRTGTPTEVLLCFSFPMCSVWPRFCLSLIVSLCSDVSHHYLNLCSPYTLLSVQCFSVRSHQYMCVFATLLLWIIKNCLALFFIVVLIPLSRYTPCLYRYTVIFHCSANFPLSLTFAYSFEFCHLVAVITHHLFTI